MLTYTYDMPLVMASILIAIIASFTGLALTSGASNLPTNKRKLSVGMAAIVLGGGIWSMHFVAILALKLPVSISYDPLWTISSVLIAILMTATALLIMHFGKRNWRNTTIAGSFLGYGIVTMHYVGMFGIQGCVPSYEVFGQITVLVLGPVTGILAIWAAYKQRKKLNIVFGTLIFGLSVSIVHYVGMYWTGFAVLPINEPIKMSIDHGNLALLVIFSAFFICASFLLTATTFLVPQDSADKADDQQRPASENLDQKRHTTVMLSATEDAEDHSDKTDSTAVLSRVPTEKNGQIDMVECDEIIAVQAEGHYTLIYTHDDRHFCSWSISEAKKKLPDVFIQTHRSFLVNVNHVSGFSRKKDNGVCLFDSKAFLNTVPVSRSRLNDVKKKLGLSV